jgi:hypothetical protein
LLDKLPNPGTERIPPIRGGSLPRYFCVRQIRPSIIATEGAAAVILRALCMEAKTVLKKRCLSQPTGGAVFIN